MSPKTKRDLEYWLNNILEPIDQQRDQDLETPEWYKIGCVLRGLIEALEVDKEIERW